MMDSGVLEGNEPLPSEKSDEPATEEAAEEVAEGAQASAKESDGVANGETPAELPPPVSSTGDASSSPSQEEREPTPTSLAGSADAAVALKRNLEAKLSEVPAVRYLADALMLSPLVIGSVGVFCLLSFLLFGFGGALVCTIAGIFYPAFESFKALEAGEVELLRYWLMYWVVFGMITSCEHLFYYVLVFFPFYYPMKLLLLIWLSTPQGGASLLYVWLVAPILDRNRETIEATLSRVGGGLRKSLSDAIDAGARSAVGAGAGGMVQLKRSLSILPAMGPGVLTLVAQQVLEGAQWLRKAGAEKAAAEKPAPTGAGGEQEQDPPGGATTACPDWEVSR